jgi:hypothetical protein
MNTKDWATLGTYHWSEEAFVIRSALESAGIPCTMMDEQSFSINPAMTAMEVHLLVPADRLEEARALLEAQAPAPEGAAPAEDSCACGGKEFEPRPRHGLNLARFLLGLFALQPSRPARDRKFCRKCGAEAN